MSALSPLNSALQGLRAQTLRELQFINEPLGDEGAIALADELQKNTSLLKLRIVEANVSDLGADALASALAINTSITTFLFISSQCSKRAAKAFRPALIANPILALVHIDVPDPMSTLPLLIKQVTERNKIGKSKVL